MLSNALTVIYYNIRLKLLKLILVFSRMTPFARRYSAMQTSTNGVLLGGDAIQHYQLCQEEDKEGDGRAAHYSADPSRAANGVSAIAVTKS